MQHCLFFCLVSITNLVAYHLFIGERYIQTAALICNVKCERCTLGLCPVLLPGIKSKDQNCPWKNRDWLFYYGRNLLDRSNKICLQQFWFCREQKIFCPGLRMGDIFQKNFCPRSNQNCPRKNILSIAKKPFLTFFKTKLGHLSYKKLFCPGYI